MHQPEIEEQEDNSCGNVTKNECLNQEDKKKTLKRSSSSATSVRSTDRGKYSYEEMKAIQSLTETSEDESEDENGYHEHEVLGPGPEAQESASAWEKCKKNPGHPTFIPVVKLTRQHLPKRYQGDEDFFEWIKVNADLTVRLRVTETSSKRPAGGYYGAKGKGIRTGTGFILGVCPSYEPCQCLNEECKAKLEESRKCWEISVDTARHVVYDEYEGETTKMDLFYDSEECRVDGRMKTLQGGEVGYTQDNIDSCWLMFTTCDSELVSKLKELVSRRERLEERLRGRYRSDRSDNFVCIVSHPHGMPKKISFGKVEDVLGLGGCCHRYSYSVDTCPGSSGGQVFGLSHYRYGTFNLPLDGPHHCKGGGRNGWNVGYSFL